MSLEEIISRLARAKWNQGYVFHFFPKADLAGKYV